jgi:glycine betaine/choline ABC-type transport system substrate-binding protein
MDLSLTYIALSSFQVDLIAGNSTEGRIPTLDLVQLADDRSVPLVRASAAMARGFHQSTA